MSHFSDLQGLDPRQRMVKQAAVMLCRHGLNGTSFSRLIKESGAPRGSIYHYFPNGKKQLVAEALDYIETIIADAIRGYVPASANDQPAEFVTRYFGLWRRILFGEEILSSAGVLAIVDDPANEEVIANRLSKILETWETEIANVFMRLGLNPDAAEDVANMIVITLEGSALLCRVRKDSKQLDKAESAMISFVRLHQ